MGKFYFLILTSMILPFGSFAQTTVISSYGGHRVVEQSPQLGELQISRSSRQPGGEVDPGAPNVVVSNAAATSRDCDYNEQGSFDMPLSLVGNARNPSSGVGGGSVPYVYYIGQFEVTNAEYAAFLNAVAAQSDTNLLFRNEMQTALDGGIRRVHCTNRYVYYPREFMANKPVNYVTWLSAARFVNWLEHGQPVGAQDIATTETGAYDLRVWGRKVYCQGNRLAATHWALPSGDEWTKAAKYDPSEPRLQSQNGYWRYATRTNDEPFFGLNGQSSASPQGEYLFPGYGVVNYNFNANWNSSLHGNVTSVGSTQSSSYYGAYDMNGNVAEWTQQIVCLGDVCGRNIKGGHYASNLGRIFPDGSYQISGLLVEYAPSSNLQPDWPTAGPELFYSGRVGFRVAKVR